LSAIARLNAKSRISYACVSPRLCVRCLT
jgi:hypothetical protein